MPKKMDRHEKRAREAGWRLESESEIGEDDGVRSANNENWAENWVGACAQLDAETK